jgi:outer membrane biosynthesis protein TonB
LQPHLNNDLHTFPSERGKGIAGTLIIHLVVLLFLIFAGFSLPPLPDKEEGLLVNFGTDETGSGLIEPSPPAVQEVTVPPPPTAVPEKTADDQVLTQNTEDAPVVKKADPEAEKKRLEKKEADRKRREELEAEKIIKQQEEAERKRVEAEQQRQADIMNRTKNALANSKNAGTNSTSEGVAGGAGNQGVPNGDVNAKLHADGGGTGDKGTISYSLGGRGVQELISPKYDIQKEGIVVVDISVDQDGNVTQATPGTKGSTVLDEDLLKVAKDAALKTKFEVKKDAPAVQKGTIKYIFKLK